MQLVSRLIRVLTTPLQGWGAKPPEKPQRSQEVPDKAISTPVTRPAAAPSVTRPEAAPPDAKSELEQIQADLLTQRAAIVRQSGGALTVRPEVEDAHDTVDLASESYNRSFSLQLRGRGKYNIASIDRALRKIDSGEFGICEECEEPISKQRLRAQPVTALCISCKEEQELEQRRA